jgi:hypothetical protein
LQWWRGLLVQAPDRVRTTIALAERLTSARAVVVVVVPALADQRATRRAFSYAMQEV